MHEALGLVEVSLVARASTLERAGDERVADLHRHSEPEAQLVQIGFATELRLDQVGQAVGELGLDVAVGEFPLSGVHDAEARLAPVHLGEHVEREVDDRPPVAELGAFQLVGDAFAESVDRALAQCVQHRDAVGEVAVDGADRRAGALGHHLGGEALEAGLVDDLGRRVEQRVESLAAASLGRLGSDRPPPAWIGPKDQVDIRHETSSVAASSYLHARRSPNTASTFRDPRVAHDRLSGCRRAPRTRPDPPNRRFDIVPRASRTGSTTSGNAGPGGGATSRPSCRTPATDRPNGCGSSAGCCSSKPVAPDERSKRRRRRGEQGIRGWRSFTSVPIGDVPVVIEIGGARIEVLADRGGRRRHPHPGDPLPRLARGPTPHRAARRIAAAPIRIVGPDVDFGIISDVDDTVMVTALPRPFLAFWNTFVLDEHARIPTPGMAVLFERLARAHPGSPVIYLSTGAWNVAPTLTRFLSRNLYPAGPLLLTDWGPTHDRWFRSGRAHKEENLRRLADEFPACALAAHRRRRPARRGAVRALRRRASRPRRCGRDPPVVGG